MTKMFAAFVAAVLLTACGGSNPNGPDPFPSPTPTPTPAPVVIKTVTFTDLRPGSIRFASATDIGPGRVEAVVDWTNPGNTLWVVFLDGPCIEAVGDHMTVDEFNDGFGCALGPAVKGGSKPVTAHATLTKNYKKNEEWIIAKVYSPPTNAGMEAGTITVAKFQ